jgi:hypothetical protein
MGIHGERYVIEHQDGAKEEYAWITRSHIADGVLHLWSQGGEGVREEHVASYPLTALRKWTRTER